MSNLLKQTRDSGPKRVLTPGPPPSLVIYGAGSPGTVRFADESATTSCCIGCSDRPCYRYSEEELGYLPLEGFPVDMSEQVCPTGVISPSGASGLPVINSDGCVMCGVCIARCPVGAISIDPDKGAIVQTETNRRFVTSQQGDEEEIKRTRTAFSSVERSGAMVQETDPLIEVISARSNQALTGNPRYPVIFARNLLKTLGIGASARRTGVSSTRMDILERTADGHQGVTEVEFGDEAVLDAPRDILDDVAVLVTRYGWSKGEFHTVIITDTLPNRRSEYWRIITDIQKVTDVRILTISTLSLMLAVWRRKTLAQTSLSLFYADENTNSYIREVVAIALGFQPNLSPSSNRWVNWVK